MNHHIVDASPYVALQDQTEGTVIAVKMCFSIGVPSKFVTPNTRPHPKWTRDFEPLSTCNLRALPLNHGFGA